MIGGTQCENLAPTLAETRIQLCGALAGTIAGTRIDEALPGRQGRLLFAFLALNRTRRSTRDELIDALWREPPPTADAWVDVEVALEKIHRAEAAAGIADWQAAWLPAQVALNVTSRPFLPGEDLPWVDAHRGLLHNTRVRALECLAEVGLGIGGSELGVAERSARVLVELEPYRESGYRLLMQALSARDNVAEALLVYERLRMLLRDELGVGPDTRVQELHRALLGRTG
jgi:SARP family transcriptional regulator, regulator of embCAB operon